MNKSIVILALCLVLACLGACTPPPTAENTVKLEQPTITDIGDGKPFMIVSEQPVPSGLPGYWLVMIQVDGNDTRPVLVSRGTGNDLPMDFLMPGRLLRVAHVTFGTTATGQVHVFVGTPAL